MSDKSIKLSKEEHRFLKSIVYKSVPIWKLLDSKHKDSIVDRIMDKLK